MLEEYKITLYRSVFGCRGKVKGHYDSSVNPYHLSGMAVVLFQKIL